MKTSRLLGPGLIVASLALASPAEAQLALDFKAGYAIPTGHVQVGSPVNGNTPMSSTWSGAIPLELAARWRFTPNLSLGVYYQFGPAFVPASACVGGSGCTGYDMRTGIELVYAFLPDRPLNPWFSLGTGWEWSQASVVYGGLAQTWNMNGWEYLNVQVGLDFMVSRSFGLGPYVGWFGGTYSNFRITGDEVAGGAIDPSARASHSWWQVGLKGTVNL